MILDANSNILKKSIAFVGTVADKVRNTIVGKLPDIELPGLWFYDDVGKLVEAKLELPPLNYKPLNVTKEVSFTLFTNQSLNGTRFYFNDTASFEATNFNPKKSTFIVTHGWQNSKYSQACVSIKDGNFYLCSND